jgi:hypothetical protein
LRFLLPQQIATSLEATPQDVEALGAAKENLPVTLLQYARAEQADKVRSRVAQGCWRPQPHSLTLVLNPCALQDVTLYTALCIVQLMRVCAPETPYDDEQLKVNGLAAGGVSKSHPSFTTHARLFLSEMALLASHLIWDGFICDRISQTTPTRSHWTQMNECNHNQYTRRPAFSCCRFVPALH